MLTKTATVIEWVLTQSETWDQLIPGQNILILCRMYPKPITAVLRDILGLLKLSLNLVTISYWKELLKTELSNQLMTVSTAVSQ